MTNTFLILLPIALFLVMLMGLSLWAERAGRRNRFAGEYFLGDRSLKGFVLAMTLVATYGSVSSFVSGPGLAWQLGLGWVVFAAPQIIAGFLILGVAGKKMAVVSRAAGALTVIDMIRARYGDGRGGRTLAALLAVLMLVFFTTMMIGQFIGGAQIFSKAAGVSYGFFFFIFCFLRAKPRLRRLGNSRISSALRHGRTPYRNTYRIPFDIPPCNGFRRRDRRGHRLRRMFRKVHRVRSAAVRRPDRRQFP